MKLDSRQIAWKYLTKPFQEAQFDWGSEIVAIHQLACSLLHSSSDLWVAVPQGRHINPRGKIQVGIPIHIRQRASMAPLENYWTKCHLAGVPLHKLHSSVVNSLRFRTGHIRYYVRISRQVHGSPFDAGNFCFSRGKQRHEMLRLRR